ncbi:HTH-type transcriptional activator RhaR [Pseudoalteromonas sp. CIP111854]|uniref:HTH-type transcriptional activator RhaR n=1 Tax=Pseudoalteromonas holothuriae TaxID=2963714 RepID=A0A9W4VMD8_9GAMM|nr:AraC family transcriptional regulator [Pseudoalteromonas sp. CIP111854]CAH9049802.1 HTH-type transcriptional activator RhaR [Pseudoalteromonas sp. CIP111854]
MEMADPLSLFISHLKPKCEVFSHVKLKAPWGIEEQQQSSCCFSFIKKGQCVVELSSGEAVQLSAGQLLLLPYGSAHKIMSESAVACQSIEQLFLGKPRADIENMVIGGQGESCSVMCGSFTFLPLQYRPCTQLGGALPEILVIEVPVSSKLEVIVSCLYEENKCSTPGGHLARTRWLELLLIEVLRGLDAKVFDLGWLTALQDRFLASVMLAIQSNLNKDWSVEELAKVAALSKSSLTNRFKRTTGLPPLIFLRQWRCLVAANLLISSNDPLKLIAASCGFQSDDVLIRNFRQFHHMTPIQYRKTHKK